MSKDSMAACAKVHPTTEAKYSPENGVETSPSRSRSPDKGDALAGAEDSSIREELKQTAAPRRSSVALAEATKLEEMRGEWEPSNASATCLSGACARRLLCLLGVSNKRECYGERPLNTACLLPDKKRRDYFQRDAEPDHEAIDTWWNLPWYEIPHLRHHWGEPQRPVHTGASDLFLDLVFVGVAYRVGVVLKAAFYSCKPADPYDFSGDESSSGETSQAQGRLLVAWAGEQPRCVGYGLGLFYALAPFMSMYLLWSIEREHKASYKCRSRLNYVLQLLTSLLLVIASMSIDTIASYRCVCMLLCFALLFLCVCCLPLTSLVLSLHFIQRRPRS